MSRPFLDWLQANNIDDNRTPMWPELHIDADAALIRIEQLAADADGQLYLVGDQPGTYMREFPLVESMSEDMAAMWTHMAEANRAQQRLRDVLRGLEASGATVVNVRMGQRVVMLTQRLIPHDSANLLQAMRQLLPGIEVGVASGIRAVIIEDDAAEPAEAAGVDLPATPEPE